MKENYSAPEVTVLSMLQTSLLCASKGNAGEFEEEEFEEL